MTSIQINPLWIEIGGPALLAGLVIGVFVTWLFARSRRARLETEIDFLEDKIKNQDAIQSERDAAFQAASGDLARSFADLANRSLQSNSENFLRLAEQKMNVQTERAKRKCS